MQHFTFSHLFLSVALVIQSFPLEIAGTAISIPLAYDSGASSTGHLTKRDFPLRPYSSFQISNGKAGQCLETASKVFLKPLNLTISADQDIQPGSVLARISDQDFRNIKQMARDAILAETSNPGFNSAITAAAGNVDLLAQLHAGKICNRVLKLLGEVTYVSIEVAKGSVDRLGKLDEEKTKLKRNIGADIAALGKPMTSYLSI